MPAETPLKPEEMLIQPTYAYHINMVGYPTYAIVGTISHLPSHIVWGGSSGEAIHMSNEAAMIAHNSFRSNKQFIKLEQSFLSQLDKHAATFEGQNRYALQEKMKQSAEALISCSPDKMSLETTWDGSIFYKAIKNDINVHFEHFLIDEFDGTDEAIMTIYKGNEQALNYGGTLTKAISELGKFFTSNKMAVPELV